MKIFVESRIMIMNGFDYRDNSSLGEEFRVHDISAELPIFQQLGVLGVRHQAALIEDSFRDHERPRISYWLPVASAIGLGASIFLLHLAGVTHHEDVFLSIFL